MDSQLSEDEQKVWDILSTVDDDDDVYRVVRDFMATERYKEFLENFKKRRQE